MPLYEFRCLNCQELFEILIMGKNDELEMKCPHCGTSSFEKIMSTASFCVSNGRGQSTAAKTQSRNCASGSCTTYDIPGPA